MTVVVEVLIPNQTTCCVQNESLRTYYKSLEACNGKTTYIDTYGFSARDECIYAASFKNHQDANRFMERVGVSLPCCEVKPDT